MSKIDRIDTDAFGSLCIRYIKDDGGYHRTVIPMDMDIDKQLTEVDVHLVFMKQKAVTEDDRKQVRDIGKIVRKEALERNLKIVKAPK